jgi:hypothetical protein
VLGIKAMAVVGNKIYSVIMLVVADGDCAETTPRAFALVVGSFTAIKVPVRHVSDCGLRALMKRAYLLRHKTKGLKEEEEERGSWPGGLLKTTCYSLRPQAQYDLIGGLLTLGGRQLPPDIPSEVF